MQELREVEWNSGLCDCFEDAATCCYGFWCCPCLACTVSGKFGESCALPLCDMLSPAALTSCGIPIFVPPAALALRAGIRNRYRIKGSLCKDILVSCFCVWCTWCQMHRELKHQKKTPNVINYQPQTIVQQGGPTIIQQNAPQIVQQNTPHIVQQNAPQINQQNAPHIGQHNMPVMNQQPPMMAPNQMGYVPQYPAY